MRPILAHRSIRWGEARRTGARADGWRATASAAPTQAPQESGEDAKRS
ncbi:hypothetical protein [Demequina sp. NBRC 110051]|nr:hypothetical protein [Demequina sp. NBRC 110051]